MRIEDYGLIGDLQTAALVGRNGSIDWLCVPRFDSGACFAALLGDEQRRPLADRARRRRSSRVERRYRDRTLVHELDFETDRGQRPRDRLHAAARRGSGRRPHRRGRRAGGLDAHGARDPVRLRLDRALGAARGRRRRGSRSPGPMRSRSGRRSRCTARTSRTVAEFTVSAGERLPFVLTWFPSHRRRAGARSTPKQALEDTCSFWRDWVGPCTYGGRWSDAVVRSLIVLKALTYAPTGGIVAAPTTSLPEQIGGVRNWDYRYCWLRDATFALARARRQRLHRRGARLAALAAARRRRRSGRPADHVRRRPASGGCPSSSCRGSPGYEGSQPVRIGNGASTQFQLDVYGEVLDVLHQARRARPRAGRGLVGAAARAARVPRAALARAGRGDLGGARRRGATSPTRR